MKKKLKTIAIQGFGFVGAVNSVNVAVSSHLKDYQVLCFEKKKMQEQLKYLIKHLKESFHTTQMI